MKKTNFWFAVLGLALAMLACGRGGALAYETIEVGDLSREFLVHLPAGYDDRQDWPLVLVFHGGGGQARNMPRFTGFNDLADQEGFIAVYPNGVDNGWSDGREGIERQEGVDDVAFIAALLDHLEAEYAIDRERVYATGISNGGFFTQTLLCDMGDRFAGGVALTANLSEALAADCTPAEPVSIMYINGTDDPLVPYDGGQVMGDRGAIRSTDASVGWWVEVNGCDATPMDVSTQDDDPDDETSITTTVYGGCDDGVSVALMRIEGGGHTWPGGSQYLPAGLIGTVSREIEGSAAVWAFFER